MNNNTVTMDVTNLLERQGTRIDGVEDNVRELEIRMVKAEGALAAFGELKDDIKALTEVVRSQSLAVHDVVKALAAQKRFVWYVAIPIVAGLAIEVGKHLLGF